MATSKNLISKSRTSLLVAACLAAILCVGRPVLAQGPGADVLLPENSTMRVSDHVYVIMGFPNVAIVVGNHATMVVDTGLGPRNGAVAAREAEKLAKNAVLYLTATHFHPEHAAGEGGFPPNTILIRPAIQEKELEENGAAVVERFSASPQNAQLLRGVKFRKPDMTFDKDATLDLGGVTVRLSWMGPAHTLGDEIIWVEPDKTLIPGDVVQNKMLPNLSGPDARLNSWIDILSRLKTLQARYVVPDHGTLGDGSLVDQEYNFLTDLKGRALELKSQGKTAAEARTIVLAEFKTKYSAWPNLNNLPNLVTHIYSENP